MKVAPVQSPAPPGRMAYWPPSPRLEDLISGYHLYAVSPPPGERHSDVFQPAWFNLRVLLDPATNWEVRCGKGEWLSVPDVSLFGPSSAACWSRSDEGAVIGAGITPRGWARLATCPAGELADRVVPAGDVLGPGTVALAAQLRAAGDSEAIVPILDRWFLERMTEPARDEDAIERIFASLTDPAVRTVAQLAARVGLVPRTLERISRRAFGFAPKLLLRRARFLRSLHALIGGGPGRRALAIDAGYTDYPHFIREAHEFLGMKPTRFLERCGPMFLRSLQLRHSVLGAPAQALAAPANPPAG
jgi:AraC-like DNA-binding protein